jgi:hypothetical protein
MNRETRKVMKELKQRLTDFFFIYYDHKTSRHIYNHPENAVPMIREAISTGITSRSRLAIYGTALRDSLEYQRLLLEENQRKALVS